MKNPAAPRKDFLYAYNAVARVWGRSSKRHDELHFVSSHRFSALGASNGAFGKARKRLETGRIKIQPDLSEDIGMTVIWGAQMGRAVGGSTSDPVTQGYGHV